MDVGQLCLCVLTIRSQILQQCFRSVTWVASSWESNSGLQIMPKCVVTDSELVSASRREKRQRNDSCVQVLRETLHGRSSVGGLLLLS